MGLDKYYAIKGKYRVSEKTFFVISAALGSIGVYIGMYIFRHKTKHNSFVFGMPFILALQITVIIYILNKIGGIQ